MSEILNIHPPAFEYGTERYPKEEPGDSIEGQPPDEIPPGPEKAPEYDGPFGSILGGEGVAPFRKNDKEQAAKPIGQPVESKEQLPRAEMSVSIDGEYIRSILEDNPELVPEDDLLSMDMDPRRRELQTALDSIARLPERLEFKPGVTLIFGENGGGKTTLANAIRLSLNAQKLLENGGYDSYEEALGHAIDDDRIHSESASENIAAQGLSPYIAKGIRISQHSDSRQAPARMFDLSMVKGSKGGNAGAEANLSDGGSTRQTVKTALGVIGRKLAGQSAMIFIDEPGIGASPRAQEQLAGELEEVAGEDSSLIVCSNSYALWMKAKAGEIPYIDLTEEPEKGVQ